MRLRYEAAARWQAAREGGGVPLLCLEHVCFDGLVSLEQEEAALGDCGVEKVCVWAPLITSVERAYRMGTPSAGSIRDASLA